MCIHQSKLSISKLVTNMSPAWLWEWLWTIAGIHWYWFETNVWPRRYIHWVAVRVNVLTRR